MYFIIHYLSVNCLAITITTQFVKYVPLSCFDRATVWPSLSVVCSAFDRGLSAENRAMAAAVEEAFSRLQGSVDNRVSQARFHNGIANAQDHIVRAVDRALANIRVLATSVAEQPAEQATRSLHRGIDSATGKIYVAVDKAANDIHVVARTVPDRATDHGTSVLHLGVEEATNAIYEAVERSVGCIHELANSALGRYITVYVSIGVVTFL